MDRFEYRIALPAPSLYGQFVGLDDVNILLSGLLKMGFDQVYEVGKRHPFPSLRDWFKACYEILLGQEQGPRLGSFFALYGLENSKALIKEALAR